MEETGQENLKAHLHLIEELEKKKERNFPKQRRDV